MPNIKIQSLDSSSFDAHVALPAGEHGPGLIVIRGLFSKQEAIEKLCASYATLGFAVVCPDIFHRHPETSAGANEEPDWERAHKLYTNFDVEASVRDLLATLAFIRKMPGCAGKVGTVGYCLGCRLSFLMASRSDIDCTVGFYGVGLEGLLDEIYDIRMPTMLHFAENDKLIQPTARQKILKALTKNPAIVSHIYEGAEHGFMREESPTYHPNHAGLANMRTREFLVAHLED